MSDYSPSEQYRRYRLANANPASSPDSQLARRLAWQRELRERQSKAIRDQLALQQRQAANIRAKVTAQTRKVRR